MPTNNVDLTAILPALKEAVAPFEAAMTSAQKIKINPGSLVRNFAPLAGLSLGEVGRLVESVQAIRRMAGDLK
jgi:hypothetical protein